ncbi:MAG: 50S ribosomal protein L5 [Flavobacteriales bacterium]|nr:50S ribosomal protein L5 [Flavobacteriales bacterium]
MSYVPRLKQKYKAEVIPAMQTQFNYKSSMQVPKITKICINQGLGDAVADKKLVEAAIKELSIIAGQKAVPTHSRKDISNFKLRKGMPIGARVTLRGDVMYEFLDRLISVSLPRTRDFRGVNAKGFDGKGNFTFGVKEHIIFPEINIDKVNKILGMDITFVTTATTNEEAFSLLKEFGFPFTKK